MFIVFFRSIFPGSDQEIVMGLNLAKSLILIEIHRHSFIMMTNVIDYEASKKTM